MKIIYTKDSEWLLKWDEYILHENRGSHLLLSDWNKSFHSYGFDYEICICLENETICGGFVAVVAKALMFKFYIVPYGPIVTQGYENNLNELINVVPERAKFYDCCYCHVTIPFSTLPNQHVFNSLPDIPALYNANTGHLFKYVYSSSGLNWIDLKNFDEESKILSLKPSVRRNVRNSYRKNLIFVDMNSKEKIIEGYELFVQNSKLAQYEIRDWKDIKNSFFSLLEKKCLKMLGAYANGELKGAILLVKSGKYYTYILGGSKKEVPDLRTGDFLQWEAIKLSLQNGFDGYNISLGGSKGVVEFKNSFNTESLFFENSKYHWILKPKYFKFYLFFEKNMKSNKKILSKILSMLKK